MSDEVYDPFANQELVPEEPVAAEGEDPASALLSDSSKAGVPPLPSRENALANTFEDPSALLELTGEAQQPLLQETAEAVQELVMEPMQQQTEEQIAAVSGNNLLDSAIWFTKSQMADKLFTLVLSEHKFDILVEKALEVMLAAVDAQAGSILEYDRHANDFFFRAPIGEGDNDVVKSFRVPWGKGIVGHVAESKNIVLINDLDDNKMELKSISLAAGLETKSCIAAPIMVAGQLYGVLEVFNRRGINYFNDSDKQLVSDGVKMIAKVLEVRFFSAMLWKNQRANK